MNKRSIAEYYIDWKAGHCHYNFNNITYTFWDGITLTKELLEEYEHRLIIEQNRDYWESLPWWKKIFKEKPRWI